METVELHDKITLGAPPVRNSEDYPNIIYKIKGKDNNGYNIKITQSEKYIIFIINEINDILNIKYKKELTLEEFHNINRIFRQYISLEELFNLYFKSLKEEEIIVEKLNKEMKLSLLIDFRGQKEEIIFMLKPENIHINDVIINLNEKIKDMELSTNKKIKELEEKLNQKDIIINNLIERIDLLEKNLNNAKEIKRKIDSVIIKDDELNLIESGIKHNFNKEIKNYELLIRGSRDGFESKDFQNKCFNHNFTVCFIETTDGKRFGGFTEETWENIRTPKKGPESFIFSLDKKEIYYRKNDNCGIYCYPNKSKHFIAFGNGHDFQLYDKCNMNDESYDKSGCSYDTKGNKYSLAGKEYFCVKDYEVFKINLI